MERARSSMMTLRVEMICIQETKLNELNKERCYKLWDDNNIYIMKSWKGTGY